MKDVGQRIKDLRTDRKLTQDAVAKVLGVSQAAVTALERGASKGPAALTLIKLAKYFDVDAEWLLTGEGPIAPGTSLDADEAELLITYKALSPSGRAYALDWMRDFFSRDTKGVHVPGDPQHPKDGKFRRQ